jgi:predicted RNA-binding Zn-ribbon protein involved in translation (DUF1610 family)
MNPIQVEGFQCTECGAVMEEENREPLYECSECGTVFNRNNSADGASHRCPDCNKFAAKLSDSSCPECEEGELECAELFICENCGTLFADEKEAEECCSENVK